MTTEYEIMLGNSSEDTSETPNNDQETTTNANNKKKEAFEYSTATKSTEEEENKVKIINEKLSNVYKTTILQNKEFSGTELFQDTTAHESSSSIMKLRGV